MRGQILAALGIVIIMLGCTKTERIITPNEQGQIVVEQLNLRFTFDLDDHLLTIQNFNAAAVWVKVRRVENDRPGGILFNYFIWTQRVVTRQMGLLNRGDKVTGTIWYFDIGESQFELPPDPDIGDFIIALGGLLPFSRDDFEFTVGP